MGKSRSIWYSEDRIATRRNELVITHPIKIAQQHQKM